MNRMLRATGPSMQFLVIVSLHLKFSQHNNEFIRALKPFSILSVH